MPVHIYSCLLGQEQKWLLIGAGFHSVTTLQKPWNAQANSLACLVPPSPLTFANIILVFATSSGVVTAAANPPEKIKIASTSETLLCEYECHTAYNSQGCGQHCSVINAYSTFPHVRAQVCLSKVCTQMFCFCVLTLENSSLLLNCKSKHPQGHRCLFVLDSVHIWT